MKIKVIKFEGFKMPNRAHHNDSGADCFAAKDVILEPHTVTKVPTGVGVYLPDGYDICVHCKSGLSSKGVFAANAPVDAGYRGEIHAILANVTDNPIEFKKGEKIGQFVIRPVVYADFVEEINEEGRGANGFGSTGK